MKLLGINLRTGVVRVETNVANRQKGEQYIRTAEMDNNKKNWVFFGAPDGVSTDYMLGLAWRSIY